MDVAVSDQFAILLKDPDGDGNSVVHEYRLNKTCALQLSRTILDVTQTLKGKNMTSTFEEMMTLFADTQQTLIEIEGVDEDDPMTDINVVIRRGDIAMIVRVGWGSMGLHTDVYGYRGDEAVETQAFTTDMASHVLVRD
jgi:hypothetical protein